MRAANPRLIYCSISGYGQTGPRSGEAGHDLNYIGSTGLLSLQPGPADRPVVPPALVADIGGGTFPAVINILLALAPARPDQDRLPSRHRHGRCDVHLRLACAGGRICHRTPSGKRIIQLAGGSPRYQLYPTGEGKFVACGALEEHFWSAFAAAIDLPDALKDDSKNPQATREAVAGIIASKTAAQWRPVRPPQIAARPLLPRWKRLPAIRISSDAAFSTREYPRSRAQPSRPCRCRSHRNSGVAGPKPSCRLGGG